MGHPMGGLGATYTVHLKVIAKLQNGKLVADFILALIELFALGVTTEALRAVAVGAVARSLCDS